MKFKQKAFKSTWAILLSVFFALTVSLNAEIGVKGGLSLTNMRIFGPNAGTFDSKYYKGANIGIFFNFDTDENLYIQPGFYYVVKGLTQELVSNTGANYTRDYKMEYLEMPLLLKYSFTPESTIAFYILGGGYAAYRLSAKLIEGPVSTDKKSITKPMDFGIIGGAGVDIKINRMIKFCLEGKYNLGLSNAHKTEKDSKGIIINDYNMKHRGFVLSAGLSLATF